MADEMKDWTIMVYMSGDNNLSVDMAYALENIKAVASESSKEVNILVYFDGYSRSIPTLYCDLTDHDNQIFIPSYKVENKKYPVEKIFNENSASKNSVLNFVDWCVNAEDRKAEKYGLIFSGHSFGFQGIGMLKDESVGKAMTMEEVYEFLDEIKTSIIGEKNENGEFKKLEVLGFDSCVMSMLEVGYQFKDVAETLIASEGSVPRAGWAYTEILGHLAHSTQHETINDIAKDFVRTFITKEGRYTISNASVDMSAWDLSKIDDLDKPFEKLSELLLDCFDEPKSAIYKQMKRVLLQVHKECQTYMLEQNVDLGDFCELLKAEVKSLKEELGTNFHAQINSLSQILETRKDLNADVHAQLETVNKSNEDLHRQLNGLLKNLSGRKDLSEDLRDRLDSIEYLNSDFDNKLDEIEKVCGEVSEKISKCVLLAGFSGGAYQFSNGISLFFPWSVSSYNTAKKDYEQLRFINDKNAGKAWNKFLKKYLGEVTFRKCISQDKTNHILSNPFHWSNAVQHKVSDEIIANLVSTDNKIPISTDNKIPISSDNKIPISTDNKIPISSDNKLSGGAGHYFEFFTQFDNTEKPWNISGFTRQPETVKAADKTDNRNDIKKE